jgi:nitrite reductase/ring-hydroxylating ferredoxin subunit
MKRFLSLILLFSLLSCAKQGTNRNPFLQELGFQFELNLNLPLYSPLTNPGSSIYVDNSQVGTRGAFVTNTGFDVFRVFEASCPNHAPNECSTMELNGIVATCSCDDFEYSTITGQMLNNPNDGTRYYDMLEYRASFNGGNVIIISN